MFLPSSLSASTILRANIRQDIALVFTLSKKWDHFFKNFQKYTYILTACFAFFSFLPASGYAAWEKRDFIVTAYYSPLPGQTFYLRGNYEAEKILNGNGIYGASGKPVFAGMIAAPKTYAFGTQIQFDGLGMGIVEDRWGAIVQAGERSYAHDRIDIWMGSWDAGLRRAMIWWKRKVTGVLMSESTIPRISLSDIDTGKVDLSQYWKVGAISGGLSQDILDMFADLGYTSDGRGMREMIVSYQKDHTIVRAETDDGAWVYGPKTRQSLLSVHLLYTKLRDAEIQKIETERSLLISEKDEWQNTYIVANQKVASLGLLTKWEKGTHIRDLQKVLKSSGYFKGKDTGIIGTKTILALKSLQRAHGLTATGSLDQDTRDILLELMIEYRV